MPLSREETKEITNNVKAMLRESMIRHKNRQTASQLPDLSSSEIQKLSTEDRKSNIISHEL